MKTSQPIRQRHAIGLILISFAAAMRSLGANTEISIARGATLELMNKWEP